MKLKEYRVLGHKVNYSVTESSEEFNKLDPSRPDASNDEAVSNIVYRGMNPDTRFWFLFGLSQEECDTLNASGKLNGTKAEPYEGVEAELGIERKTKPALDKSGKPRMKDNEPVMLPDESEETFYNRAIAESVQAKKFASEDAARQHFDAAILRIASYVPFDITRPERAERAPLKLKVMYKIAAAKVLSLGTVHQANATLQNSIGKTFTATNDTSTMFSGTYGEKDKSGNETQVPFNVSEKDAVALGTLMREYFTWKEKQAVAEFGV